MAVTYGFFDSVNGDRTYNADQMSKFYNGIVTSGVFQHVEGGLAVSAGSGMTVSVATGRAIVNNRWVDNSAALTLSIGAASSTYARIDAVVIKLSMNSRFIDIYVKAGEAASSPVAPTMDRSDGVYEMALAYVNVAAGATSVTVTDKRSDSAVCGWASVAQATSGEVDQMLNDLKTGFDGVVYPSPAAMVQGCDQKLQDEIDEVYITGPNLFNSNTATQGAWIDSTTGQVIPDTDDYWVSDYMDNNYSYIGTYGIIKIWFFDANKAYQTNASGDVNGKVFNASSYKYVRVGFKTANLESVTVEIGDQIPSPVPYVVPHINNDLLVDTNNELTKINSYVVPGLVDAYNNTITQIPSKIIGSAVVGSPISLSTNQYRSVGYFDISFPGSGKVVINNIYVDSANDIGYALVDKDDVVIHSETLAREFTSININCSDYPSAARIYFVYQTTSHVADGYYKKQSRVGKLEEGASETSREIVNLSFTPSAGVDVSKASNCSFTKSTGSKFEGNGNGTITFSIPETEARCVSFGVRIPYNTQNVATVTINERTIEPSAADSDTESGHAYKIQGDTYQRVNIAANGTSVSGTVTITITTEDDWELWLSDCAIANDDYSMMPILYIYDGGRWHGTVTYSGETMTIWALHRKLGIPYAIATYPGAWDDPTSAEYPVQEVLDDIASGFAEIVLRTGHMGSYYNQSDMILTGKFSDGFLEVEADNRGAVFAQHVFDKKILRCMKQANADFIRGYPLKNEDGFFSPKYGDTDMIFIPPCGVYKSISAVPMHFPIIKWAHGIGTVPQDDQAYAAFYEDPNGTETIAAMNTLLVLEENNKAQAMRPSEFISFIKAN